MQDNNEKGQGTDNKNKETTDNQMAQNPNPRANENIQNTTFEKSSPKDSTPDVGSEITDGGAG